MHIDHGSLLSLSSNELTPKVPVCATYLPTIRQSIPSATAKQALSHSSDVRLAYIS
jgi:hypothetical protein